MPSSHSTRALAHGSTPDNDVFDTHTPNPVRHVLARYEAYQSLQKQFACEVPDDGDDTEASRLSDAVLEKQIAFLDDITSAPIESQASANDVFVVLAHVIETETAEDDRDVFQTFILRYVEWLRGVAFKASA